MRVVGVVKSCWGNGRVGLGWVGCSCFSGSGVVDATECLSVSRNLELMYIFLD